MLKRLLQTTLSSTTRQYYSSNLNQLPVKNLFFRGLSTRTLAPFEKPKIWLKMSEEDKMNAALATSEPESAEIAFYKGKGLEEFGEGHYGAAINAFKKAAELDPEYKIVAEMHIGDVYKKMGKNLAAAETFKSAFWEFAKKMKNIPAPLQQEIKGGTRSSIPLKFEPGK